jgi:S1-C subfamily serine protease
LTAKHEGRGHRTEAQTTTSGGSGGLLSNDQGQIIGINFAMVHDFGGSSLALPVRFGEVHP